VPAAGVVGLEADAVKIVEPNEPGGGSFRLASGATNVDVNPGKTMLLTSDAPSGIKSMTFHVPADPFALMGGIGTESMYR
jgi:hypothetical protein